MYEQRNSGGLRVLVSSVAVLTLVGGIGSSDPKTASAQNALLTCSGTESITYHPGITNTPNTVIGNANDTAGPCVVPSQPSLTGGTAHFSVTIPNATCTSVTFPKYTISFRWNDGSESIIDFPNTVTTKLVTGETQVVSTGAVVEGVGEGSQAVRTLTALNTDLTGCFTAEGLQSNAGPFVLTFL